MFRLRSLALLSPFVVAVVVAPTTSYFFALFSKDIGADRGNRFFSASGLQTPATTTVAPLLAVGDLCRRQAYA